MDKGTEIYMKCLMSLNSEHVQETRAAFQPVQTGNNYFHFPPPQSYDETHRTLPYLAPPQSYRQFGNEIVNVSSGPYGPMGYGMMVGCSPGYMEPTARYYPYAESTYRHIGSCAATQECYHSFCRTIDQNVVNSCNFVEQVKINGNERNVNQQPISDTGYNSEAIVNAPLPLLEKLKRERDNEEEGEDDEFHAETVKLDIESLFDPAEKKPIRRPINAFLLFAKHHRSLVRAQFPNHSNRMISKILSEWWYAFPPEQKQSYYAFSDEIRYEHYRSNPGWNWRSKREASDLSPSPLIQPSERAIDRSKVQQNWLTSETGPVTAMPVLKLAPTPAQLGRARKRAKPNLTIDTSATRLAPASTPQFTDTPEFQAKLNSLPRFDYVNYRSATVWPTFSAALNPDAKLMETYETRPSQQAANDVVALNGNAASDANRNSESGPSQPKKQLVGSVFFGPDFNPAHFTNTPSTCDPSCECITPPTSADSIILRTVTGAGPNVPQKASKKLADERKTLIFDLLDRKGLYPTPMDMTEFHKLHIDLFPNKTYLNMKIREGRQKLNGRAIR